MTEEELVVIAKKLTINAAINLRSTITHPCPLNPESLHGKGRLHTGMGKWTTLAAIGVENNMISLGLGERRPPYDHAFITPLGREVAKYINERWDDLEFRDPSYDRRWK